MASITTRAAKGSALTHAEVDANFTNLNADKLDSAGITAGSASAPSIKFTNDADTGLFSPGAAQIAVTNNGTERIRVDSSGRVLLGVTSYIDAWNTSQRLVVGGSASAGITVSTADSTGVLAFVRSGDSTNGSFALVANGDTISTFQFAGGDGSTRVSAARISTVVDGTTGAGAIPGRIVFSTASSAGTLSEAFRLTADNVLCYNQAAPATANSTATLTVANLKTGIITSTPASGITLTLPTGTDTEAGFNGIYTNLTFQWSLINRDTTNAITLAGNTAHTYSDNTNIAANASARFATRRSGANTFVTYRLA